MAALKLAGVVAALAMIGALIAAVGLDEVWQALASASPPLVALGLLLVQVQIVLSAIRWRFTAQRLGLDLGARTAISDYYAGTLVNQLAPWGIAGDAMRALRHRAAGAGGWKVPAQAVVFERLAGQVAFFALGIVGLLVWPAVVPGDVPAPLAAMVRATGGIVAAVIAVTLLAVLFGWSSIRRRLAPFGPALRAVYVRDGAWMLQGAMSVAILLSYLGLFLLASAAVGAPLPWTAAVTAIPLCLLVMLVPAPVAGWGLREGAAAMLWPLYGHSAADGIAAGVLYGMISLAGALPGAVPVTAIMVRGLVRRG